MKEESNHSLILKLIMMIRFGETQSLEIDMKNAVKDWLEQYRLRVQKEEGTPDIKQWFYQAIDELEADLEK